MLKRAGRIGKEGLHFQLDVTVEKLIIPPPAFEAQSCCFLFGKKGGKKTDTTSAQFLSENESVWGDVLNTRAHLYADKAQPSGFGEKLYELELKDTEASKNTIAKFILDAGKFASHDGSSSTVTINGSKMAKKHVPKLVVSVVCVYLGPNSGPHDDTSSRGTSSRHLAASGSAPSQSPRIMPVADYEQDLNGVGASPRSPHRNRDKSGKPGHKSGTLSFGALKDFVNSPRKLGSKKSGDGFSQHRVRTLAEEEDLAEEAQAMRHQLSRLEELLDKTIEEKEMVEEELQEIKQQMNDSTATCNGLGASDLREEMELLQKQNERLAHSMDEALEREVLLVQELETLKGNTAQGHNAAESMQLEMLKEVEEECKTLRTENESLHVALEEKHEEYELLAQDARDMEAELAGAGGTGESSGAGARSSNNNNGAEMKHLKDLVEKQTAELEDLARLKDLVDKQTTELEDVKRLNELVETQEAELEDLKHARFQDRQSWSVQLKEKEEALRVLEKGQQRDEEQKRVLEQRDASIEELKRALAEEQTSLALRMKEKDAEMQKTLAEEQASLALQLKEKDAEMQKALAEEQENLALQLKEKDAEMQKALAEEQESLAIRMKEKEDELQALQDREREGADAKLERALAEQERLTKTLKEQEQLTNTLKESVAKAASLAEERNGDQERMIEAIEAQKQDLKEKLEHDLEELRIKLDESERGRQLDQTQYLAAIEEAEAAKEEAVQGREMDQQQYLAAVEEAESTMEALVKEKVKEVEDAHMKEVAQLAKSSKQLEEKLMEAKQKAVMGEQKLVTAMEELAERDEELREKKKDAASGTLALKQAERELEKRLSELQRLVQEKDEEIESLTARVDRQTTAMDSQKRRMSECAMNEGEEAKRFMEEKEAEVERLKERLAQHVSSVEGQAQEREEMKQSLLKAQLELDEKDAEIEKLTERVNQHMATIDRQEQEMEAVMLQSEEETLRLSHNHKHFMESIAEGNKELDRLKEMRQAEQKRLRTDLAERELELDNARHLLAEQEEDREALESAHAEEAHRLRTERNALQAELQEAQEKIAQVLDLAQELEDKAIVYSEQVEEATAAQQALQEDKEAVQQLLERERERALEGAIAKASSRELTGQVEAMTTQLAAALAEKEGMEKEIKTVRRELQSAQVEAKTLARQVDSHGDAEKAKRELEEELQAAQEETRAALREKEKELQAAQLKAKTLARQVDLHGDAEKAKRELEEELQAAQEEAKAALRDKEKELQAAQQKAMTLSRQVDLHGDAEKAKRELEEELQVVQEEAKAAMKEMEKELQAAQQKAKTLARQMDLHGDAEKAKRELEDELYAAQEEAKAAMKEMEKELQAAQMETETLAEQLKAQGAATGATTQLEKELKAAREECKLMEAEKIKLEEQAEELEKAWQEGHDEMEAEKVEMEAWVKKKREEMEDEVEELRLAADKALRQLAKERKLREEWEQDEEKRQKERRLARDAGEELAAARRSGAGTESQLQEALDEAKELRGLMARLEAERDDALERCRDHSLLESEHHDLRVTLENVIEERDVAFKDLIAMERQDGRRPLTPQRESSISGVSNSKAKRLRLAALEGDVMSMKENWNSKCEKLKGDQDDQETSLIMVKMELAQMALEYDNLKMENAHLKKSLAGKGGGAAAASPSAIMLSPRIPGASWWNR
ncbi:unnamed protein product [Chrysoparadoxa australica]